MNSPVLDALLNYIDARIDLKIEEAEGRDTTWESIRAREYYDDLKQVIRKLSGLGD